MDICAGEAIEAGFIGVPIDPWGPKGKPLLLPSPPPPQLVRRKKSVPDRSFSWMLFLLLYMADSSTLDQNLLTRAIQRSFFNDVP
ncbi:MAG: hypothetical protein ACYTG7_12265 [Planctomycetota bacterium]|jgi:hypothetical protein